MKNKLIWILFAGVIYALFAFYLYLPYLEGFEGMDYLVVFGVVAGALGVFILSLRWVHIFWAAFFAGAMYGFCPFVLNLGRYDWTVTLLGAAAAWAFMPAVLAGRRKLKIFSGVLYILPFAGIGVFFLLARNYNYFPVSIKAVVVAKDMVGFLSPMVAAKQGFNCTGFYHVAVVPFLIGMIMLIKGQRFGLILIPVVSVLLSMSGSFCSVSPAIWFLPGMVCFAIMIGVGFEGLVLAGASDRKFLFIGLLTSLTLAGVSMSLATKYFQSFLNLAAGYARFFGLSAQLYLLAAIMASVLFFIARSRSRYGLFRQLMIVAAMGADIFICSQYIVSSAI